MANEDHLKLLRQGVDAWNAWREKKHSVRPDLTGANLREAKLKGAVLAGAKLNGADLTAAELTEAELGGADLIRANLTDADLDKANLSAANLSEANLRKARLHGADLTEAVLRGANLSRAYLREANFTDADLRKADLSEARLFNAKLRAANLSEANFGQANLSHADLVEANLRNADFRGAGLVSAKLEKANLRGAKFMGAYLNGAFLGRADLSGADLGGADLRFATLVQANLENTNLTGCRVYGTSVWDLKLSKDTKQRDLVITYGENEYEVTVDNIEVAQFVYLLTCNEKIRDAIDTIGKKGVLLLGRFTEGRIDVLERLRKELRKRDFLPMVFNFDKPEIKNFTETVRLLAGLSRFVIVDITDPRSVPLELQAIVPECMVPFFPIQDRRDKLEPFTMVGDLQISHRDQVAAVIRYPSVDRLIEVLDSEIIAPAQKMFADLLARKAEQVRIKDV